jgi:glycosyltransferase involved in cell wall biosynthesis
MNPSEDRELHLRLESELPSEIEVGRGNLLLVHGWCFHSRLAVRGLEVTIDGEAQPLIAQGMPRPDIAGRLGDSGQRESAYRSGFWGYAKLREVEAPRRVEIGLAAKLAGGGSAWRRLGEVLLTPRPRRHRPAANGSEPRVAICMATYDPGPDLFRRQIESIREQTHGNWVCLISDDDSPPQAAELIAETVGGDPRFEVSRGPRLGVYRNFERALALAPDDAEFVAFADHDDDWRPDKLTSLIAEMRKGTTLAFSDMRVVGEDGATIHPTFWTTRERNDDDLGAQIIVNSVTGAASLFRAELLDYLLPFPEQSEGSLHDHWLGMVAMSLGRIGFVDRPLYDYVQHGRAELGHARSVAPPRRRGGSLRTALSGRAALRQLLIERLGRMRRSYAQVLRVSAAAELLLLRGGKAISMRKRRLLRRLARLERSPTAWAWLLGLALRSRSGGRSRTLQGERMLLGGSLWRAMLAAVKALRLPAVDPRRQTLSTMLKLPLASEPAGAAHLQELIEPLRLDVSADAPKRINLVVPTIDLGHFFGGYIAKFNLARKLAEAGLSVRVLVVDEPFYLPADWRAAIERFEGLDGVGELIEIEMAYDRSEPVTVSPGDRFIATTWWTAHVAHRATQDIGAGRFVYLIQECEPLTMPMGSEAALARQTYDFPHLALFSTELLRDYFRAERIGVFAGADGEEDSVAFENAITPVRPPTDTEMHGSERKLLFYARPEQHAERNMFELGMLALAQAHEEGTLDGWELHGIGAQQPGEVRLGSDLRLRILERQEQASYGDLLRGHAVGLSLMLTPHPSLVPLEMAAAGMPVVTNTFENKTREALQEISSNLIAVEPTIDAITDGIREAVAASTDHERRLRGAEVHWSRSWEDSFDAELVEQVRGFLERA